MKKLLLFITTLLFVFTLSACGNQERTVRCQFDFMGTQTESVYVFNKNEIISMTILGVTYTSEENADEFQVLLEGVQSELPGEDNFYDVFDHIIEQSVTDDSVSCTMD